MNIISKANKLNKNNNYIKTKRLINFNMIKIEIN